NFIERIIIFRLSTSDNPGMAFYKKCCCTASGVYWIKTKIWIDQKVNIFLRAKPVIGCKSNAKFIINNMLILQFHNFKNQITQVYAYFIIPIVGYFSRILTKSNCGKHYRETQYYELSHIYI